MNTQPARARMGQGVRLPLLLGSLISLCTVLIVAVLISPHQAAAANTGVRINKVMAGANGNSKIQFIELEAQSSSEKCWGPQNSGSACFAGASESVGRAMLLFFNAAGSQTGRYVFPSDPGGTSNTVLVATQAFADQPGAPAPDFIMPPEVMANDGQVCFRGNLDNPNASSVNLCLSYGAFSGPQQPNASPGDPVGGPFSGPLNGPPVASPLLINSTLAITRRTSVFGDHLNSHFSRVTSPTPRNSAGQTFSFPTATLEEVGANLFFNETFNGNGRTCGTCHKPADSFGLSPATVAALPTSDPLFVAEYNLNTLTLAARSQPSDLRGLLTSGSGTTASVLAGSETSYLVYGGSASLVGQTVTDPQGNSALVSAFSLGDLNQLENPTLMRNGRALILVNANGFSRPAVARTSPHLLNIEHTRPFGLSSDNNNLDDFTSGAVVQHNPRRMARVTGLDFRPPTTGELTALVAFMNTINLPRDENFSLDRLVTTEAQKRGRALFQSEFNNGFNCDTCHENQVFAAIDKFNTQVGRLPINDAQHDNLPRDLREFSTSPLFGIRDTAPYFHDNSVFTLREAVAFYGGPEFQTGPDAFLVNPVFFNNPQNIDDVVAFLEALVEPVTDFTRTLDFGSQPTADGPTASQTIIITNISDEALSIGEVVLNGSGAAQFLITAQPNPAPFNPGETRTVQVAFDPAATGAIAATLEFTAIRASNGEAYASGTALSGTGTNSPPTLSSLPNQAIFEDTPSAALPLTVGDPESPPGSLTLSGASANPLLLPATNIVFGGSDSSRTVTLIPAPDQNGTTVITLTVSDGAASDSKAFTLTVNPVNDAPSFTPGPNQEADDSAGPQTVVGWATELRAGPPDEAGQALAFFVSNDSPGLFSAQPALNPDGTLTYTPQPGTVGVARVTVVLSDDGGTADGGQDSSPPATFTISIGLNQPPSFTPGADQTMLEDAGPQTVSGWATNISPGPPEEAGQALTFVVSNDNSALFSAQPAISPAGTLTFTPAANANGSALVTVVLTDDGGTANGGQDSSPPVTFTISLTPVNDRPSFTPGPTQTVLEDAGPKTVSGWATNINPGAANEAGQALTFVVSNSNSVLFSVQPAISANGTLSYTPAANRSGQASVTVTLRDDGGTANGGQDSSSPATFTIRVTAVNDPPSFTPGSNQIVTINSGPQTVVGWATGISPGPVGEANQVVNFILSNDNNALFSVQPAIAANGTLTYTPAAGQSGVATVTVLLHDNGGTANGGQDTSAPVTFTITITP
jgi:cytochrome c peroxidase